MSEKCAKKLFRGYSHYPCSNAALPGRKYCKAHDVPDEKFTIWSARDWSDCPEEETACGETDQFFIRKNGIRDKKQSDGLFYSRDKAAAWDWLIAQKQRKWENAEKAADSAAENLRAAKAKREAECTG
jgi:hypothetical protein